MEISAMFKNAYSGYYMDFYAMNEDYDPQSRTINSIKSDLEDKNFSKQEIEQIIQKDCDKETMYKFVAYTSALGSPYTREKELEDLLTELFGETPSKEDVHNIFVASETIDF